MSDSAVTPVAHGIQETKEALIGINELALALAERFADGVQFGDMIAFWDKLQKDEVFRAKLTAAYEGWSKVSAEVGDLDVQESLELVTVQMNFIPRYIETLKKGPAAPVAPIPETK